MPTHRIVLGLYKHRIINICTYNVYWSILHIQILQSIYCINLLYYIPYKYITNNANVFWCLLKQLFPPSQQCYINNKLIKQIKFYQHGHIYVSPGLISLLSPHPRRRFHRVQSAQCSLHSADKTCTTCMIKIFCRSVS